MLRRFALVGVASLAVMAAAEPAEALQRDRGSRRIDVGPGETLDTTFRMERGGLLDLELVSGHIIVTGASGNQVRIRAQAEEGRISLRASPTLASLSVEYDGRPRGEVRYEVSVPDGVRVSMEAVSGNITARNVGADLEASTVSGIVELRDIGGLADVEAVSGNITASGIRGGINIDATSGTINVSDVDGEVIIENTSGTITLTDIRSRLVRAETVSGSVLFQGAIEPAGRYEFASHSGSIRLTLPPSTGAQLSLSTFSGSLSSDFPITLEPRSRSGEKRLEFRVGNGGARLSAETFSGSISITRGTGRDRQE